MRHSPILSTTLVISIVSLAGCEIAGDIFKAGVWVGAILVIGIIGLVIWMLTKAGSCPDDTFSPLSGVFKKSPAPGQNLKGRVNSIPA